VAFEQDELAGLERLRGKGAAALDKILQLAGSAAFPPRKRDVRVKGAPLGFQPDSLAHTLNLCSKSSNRIFRFDSCPECTAISLLEVADASDPKSEALGSNGAQCKREVVRHRPVNFTQEPKGQVQLLLALPIEAWLVVHCIDKQVENVLRRPNGDEQAMHAL
jgi:hypothetical protein